LEDLRRRIVTVADIKTLKERIVEMVITEEWGEGIRIHGSPKRAAQTKKSLGKIFSANKGEARDIRNSYRRGIGPLWGYEEGIGVNPSKKGGKGSSPSTS